MTCFKILKVSLLVIICTSDPMVKPTHTRMWNQLGATLTWFSFFSSQENKNKNFCSIRIYQYPINSFGSCSRELAERTDESQLALAMIARVEFS